MQAMCAFASESLNESGNIYKPTIGFEYYKKAAELGTRKR